MSTSDNNYIALWVFASLIACFPSLGLLSAAFYNGEFIPVGNDAFYHATRMLDAADGNFYQFDPLIHVPEGSWITWPWAYDYFMGQALRVGLVASPTMDPMKFLAYVPVFWLLVNVGLFVLILRRTGIRFGLAALAGLAFALLPLNQALHGVGMLDHHFMELTFTLLMVWLGLAFYEQPTRTNALLLGLSLGIAPGMHTSLFILQVPVLLAAGVFWLRGTCIDRRDATTFSAGLLLATLVIVIPSGPFREGYFEYTTLSSFHLFIAFCTAAVMVLLSRFEPGMRNTAIVGAIAALLGVPVLFEILTGANYVAGGQVGLQDIIEVSSPFELWKRSGDHTVMTRYYSSLIFAAPLFLIWFGYRLLKARTARTIFLNTAIVFGLFMLLAQFRFQPFGSWALLLAPALLADKLLESNEEHAGGVLVALTIGLALCYVSPVRHILFERFPPSANTEYAVVHDSLKSLESVCADTPGTVLAAQDNGHPVRFHTDCAVIANNFLLTRQHGEKYSEVAALLELAPDELTAASPVTDYVLVHLNISFVRTPNGILPTPIEQLRELNPRLFVQLAIDNRVPDNFELLHERRVEDERNIPVVQIYKIHRD